MKVRQAVIRGKMEIALEAVEISEAPLAANEALIETESSFISAGTELSIYTGAEKLATVPGSWCCYPWKPGYGNVGTILDAGEEHRPLIGRRVYTIGPHASVFRYGTDRRYCLLAPVPAGLATEDAVAARMAMVAMSALDVSKPQYFRWVVVIGLGMVGNLAAQLFRLTGANVIGVDPSATRRRLAGECGIPHAIWGSEEEVAAQVREITGGGMADVSVDAVGHSGIAMQALRLTADAGEVIVLGTPRTEVTGNLTDVFAPAHRRWITVKGCLEWYLPTEATTPQEHSQRKKLDALFGWIADGRLKMQPLITHRLPGEEIKTAYDGLLDKKEEYVGVVLRWK